MNFIIEFSPTNEDVSALLWGRCFSKINDCPTVPSWLFMRGMKEYPPSDGNRSVSRNPISGFEDVVAKPSKI